LDKEWKIPLYKIYTDDEDLNLITKIIKRGEDWAIGPEITELENLIGDYIGCDYCATLNSGTSSLHATLLAYGLKKEDEVIIPSFSFVATANSVGFVSAKPIFVDIEEENYGLDPLLINEKISSKTKAIIPMDYGGLSCKINEIKQIALDNNLTLIEDSAECLGAEINGEKVGSISDTSIFSFCGNKILTTGEGGVIVTNDKSIYEKIKLVRSHGRLDQKQYFNDPSNPNYIELGYNWRMSSITAGLGISQMHKIDKIIDMRRNHAQYLSNRLSKHQELSVPREPNGYKHIYQMYTITLNSKKIRDSLQKYLLQKKIFCKIYFNPIHQNTFYKSMNQKNDLPITEIVSDKVLTLPMYPNMDQEEKNYLINSIDEFFEISQ